MHKTLSQLQQDHAKFLGLFQEVERQMSIIAAGGRPDVERLRSIAIYFEDYATKYHHPKEELIYGHLVCQVPRLAEDLFTMVNDHHRVAESAGVFRRAVEGLDSNDPASRSSFCRVAREFVDRERGHLELEENRFFPWAEKTLTAEQWAEVDRAMPEDGRRDRGG